MNTRMVRTEERRKKNDDGGRGAGREGGGRGRGRGEEEGDDLLDVIRLGRQNRCWKVEEKFPGLFACHMHPP
jgi:hypothetical protein